MDRILLHVKALNVRSFQEDREPFSLLSARRPSAVRLPAPNSRLLKFFVQVGGVSENLRHRGCNPSENVATHLRTCGYLVCYPTLQTSVTGSLPVVLGPNRQITPGGLQTQPPPAFDPLASPDRPPPAIHPPPPRQKSRERGSNGHST